MSDRGKAIYINARRYAKASYALNSASSQSQDIDLLLPSLVNGALALELYFKSLFYLERSADFVIAGRHSHNFACLFDELMISTQKEIDKYFADLMKRRSMVDVEKIEKASAMVVPRDLKGNLKAWSEVFLKVRYIYDVPGKHLPMMFFPEIEKSVLQAIYQRQPEWN